MLLQISAAIVAVAFAVLAFYLIQTLKALKISLDEITATMSDMKNEANEISNEVKDVIQNTNEMALDVRNKLAKLNHLFSSVNDVGQVAHELTSAFKQSAAGLMASVKLGAQAAQPGSGSQQAQPARLAPKLNAIAQGAGAAMELWRSWKTNRTARTSGLD
ncbi:DUF948 domain-containing protein [Paenibacillus athensensis]|uniref:DUF948 domain-containing protein n=1 Tax=Paenibacillus athensensis TaxID=1967502 RepID=A0A4Y8PYL6_9BACL|nr:DUF948 domain-containing protein [Paenibacillus athensensis]MCD1261206.1 DUF948 domain-containing protein [Paenibacillus athensensis]